LISPKPELAKCMHRDAAELLYGNAFSGILISVVASSFLAFAFSNPLTADFKLVWWLFMATILSLRFVDLIFWTYKHQNTEFNGKKALLHFITGANCTAILWSVYAIYIISHTESIELTTSIIIISAIAGGSVTVLAAHKYTAMFYSFILLAPSSIGLLVSDIYAHQILGILGLSFSLVMIIVSKKSADFTSNAVILKNENALLVNHMEEQVNQRTQKIYELSNLDPLTGLFNRTAFINHLTRELDKSKTTHSSMALLFIDLDDFKKINDTIGHEAGDLILEKTAERLRSDIPNSQLLCRWGGDEFLVILPGSNESQAIAKARELIERLSEAHLFENNRLSVGATIGVALSPEHAVVSHRLIQQADTAMYYQKKHAPGSAGVFSEQLDKQQQQELRLKDGLTDAINQQQLRLVFQPIMSTSNGQINAFEALLRWKFEGEDISPEQFIPIAEQYGLIQKIGTWVLNAACHQASDWDKEQQVAVCVNVSVLQLQEEDFIEIVDAALADSKLTPELLHIEITESVFATDKNIISNKIKRLQSRGIKVSIDDFGTGYSSLSVMQDLAVNIVKIDRSFINSINSNGFAIITAVMHIAALLDYFVVAEGVETEEQMLKLSKLGVHFLQGFYFSKPIEESYIKDYLNQKRLTGNVS